MFLHRMSHNTIPIQQGLRLCLGHEDPFIFCHNTIPIQQGLRLYVIINLFSKKVCHNTIPIQQGLRLIKYIFRTL